jgi:hypothetical protein
VRAEEVTLCYQAGFGWDWEAAWWGGQHAKGGPATPSGQQKGGGGSCASDATKGSRGLQGRERLWAGEGEGVFT